ncbi:MAG: glycosyltransferase family 39 protein [Sphingobium sp.]|nr:glycosyltransferase family 39 protein [Sphingobium sp.]
MTDANLTAPAWARAPLLPLILLVVTLLARAQTFGNPVIEFDEQYYRLIGERMLDGALPYVDLWDRKPIGLFLLYAGAAAIGGAHALSYQLLAVLFVAATASTVFVLACRVGGGVRGSLIAAILYILWLNLLQGEGGQAPVFYMLPMCAAALLVLRLAQGDGDRLARDGLLAMLLVGLAVQVKYTVVLEGMWFGLMLLWIGRRRGLGVARLAGLALLWIAAALLPTLLAWGGYAAMGQSKAWVFANVTSIFLRAPMPFDDLLGELAGGIATMLLLFVAACLGWRRRERHAGSAFLLGWAVVALLALVAVRSFSPHYWIPSVVPLVLIAAPALDAMKRLAAGLVLLALVVGQALVGIYIYGKGDARTVAHMKAAIGPTPHCLYVFDGFPALYQATGSCLPSPYLFPSLLNGVMEESAIGVDPVTEVTRIMASRPDAVVLDEPRWSLRNMKTNAVVDRELAAHYTLVLREETGKGRFRMVYRVKPDSARH